LNAGRGVREAVMRVSAAMRQSVEPEPAAEGLQVTPVDLKHLRRYTLGDAGLEREILELFLGQLPNTIAALASAATPKDWRIAAHTLKGSGRAVGAWRIARIAEQAERSEGVENPSHVAHTIELLEEAADEARVFIKAAYG
jgi:HPt (histidine-containing phosphotransfer) domain-containing protein